MQLLSFLPFLIIVIVSAVIIVLAVRKTKKERKILRRLSDAVGASGAGNAFSGVHDGTQYHCRYFAGSKNSPSYFRIAITCRSEGDFEVTKESRVDTFFKKLGVSSEVQTGDPEFDKEFYVVTENPDFAFAIFIREENRKAVREIFRLGFNSIKHDGEVMEAVWSPFLLKEDLDPAFITATVPHLSALSGAMPVIPRPISSDGWRAKRAAAFAAPIILIIVGFASMAMGLRWFPALDEGALFLDSLSYSLPLLALSLWISVKLVKGRASSHKDLIGIILLFLTAFPVAGFGLEVFLNGWLDNAPPATHLGRVDNKYSTSSKNNTNYYVVLESWRKPRTTEKLQVDFSLYGKISSGRSWMNVETKPGRFGFEWIWSYSLAGPPPG